MAFWVLHLGLCNIFELLVVNALYFVAEAAVRCSSRLEAERLRQSCDALENALEGVHEICGAAFAFGEAESATGCSAFGARAPADRALSIGVLLARSVAQACLALKMSWAGLDLSGASIVAVLGARDADVGHALGAGLVLGVFLAAEGTIVSELCWAVLPALGANAGVSLVALIVAKSAPLLHAWRAGRRRLADAAAIRLNPAALLCRGKDTHERSGRGSDFH